MPFTIFRLFQYQNRGQMIEPFRQMQVKNPTHLNTLHYYFNRIRRAIMNMLAPIILLLLSSLISSQAYSQTNANNTTSSDNIAKVTTNPKYDAQAAQRLGADQRGMRSYVLVILKTGPNKIAPGKERDEMFAGHFANIKKLAAEGKLALAGPFDGAGGWRGLFIFAVKDIEEAKQLTATDPVIIKGEMIAEYHPWYGSAAVMDVIRIHETLTEKIQ